MRVAIFGYGSMGRRHARYALEQEHDVIVWEPDVVRRPDVPGIEWAQSESAAFDAEPDAVIIATPGVHHEAALLKALDDQVHVFVEKPLTTSHASAAVVVNAARRVDGVTRQVGYNLRHHAIIKQLQHRVLPRVGDPIAARFSVSCDAATWPGSDYVDTILECSHEIDLALWFLGPATVVGAAASSDRHVWEILLSHASGAMSSIRIDDRYDGYRRSGEIVGTDAALRWAWDPTDAAEPWMCRWGFKSQGRKAPISQGAKAVTPEDTYRAEMAAFFAATKVGRPGDPSFSDGLAVLQIIESAADAVFVGSAVRRS